jgi:nickel/cobalt transporter (NicO) family protein
MKMWRRMRLIALSLIGLVLTGLLHGALPQPVQAHWADLAVAEVQIQPTQTDVALTVPTGLIAIADTNQDQRVTAAEVQANQTALRNFLSDRVIFKTVNQPLSLTSVQLQPIPKLAKTNTRLPGSHTALQLHYRNPQKSEVTAIAYRLFLPGVPTATCVASILNGSLSREFIFSPHVQDLVFNGFTDNLLGLPVWTALLAAFVWGAFHSLSPGHGKTIVGAYLTGAKATAQHALFLGLTTTVTHTTGVFLLGLVALFASNFIEVEQLLPWFSVFSGVLIVSIGLQLLRDRWRRRHHSHSHAQEYPHSHDHGHDHVHPHSHNHDHGADDHGHIHPHSHHVHVHGHHHPHELARFQDEATIRWSSLIAIGISGGLVPCPSALILLLSSISLGHVSLGLLLVLAFSLGLAGVLTGLGLLLIYARSRFERVSMSGRLLTLFPALSAVIITLFGIGLTANAVLTLRDVL